MVNPPQTVSFDLNLRKSDVPAVVSTAMVFETCELSKPPNQTFRQHVSLMEVKSIASAVPDPELPYLTVEDLGILRDVTEEEGVFIISLSPTYSGCPAVQVIEQSVADAFSNANIEVSIKRVMSPAWTTDWITHEGREKLLANGIVPPVELASKRSDMDSETGPGSDMGRSLGLKLFATTTVPCPGCQSENTERVSEFGSTPCKAQYTCRSCTEPFEYFKCF